MFGAYSSMNSDRKAMVKSASMVERTALPRLAPTLSAGLPSFWAACWSLGALVWTQVSRWKCCRVRASFPWPFSSWLTIEGSFVAKWVSALTSG